MKSFAISIFTALVLAPCSFAILDTNNNGVSDLWERDFNNGSLFDGSFDPQADNDSDGWSNIQEAAAGTNPFNPNPPDGLVQPLTGHTPEVRSEPDEYGSSYIITPEAVTVSWPTLVGKQYTLLFSPDLSAGSWLPIGDAFIGNGNEVTYGFTITESDKRFWRVAVSDVDSDSDGLTDHEEHLVGSNPANIDSDSDGLSDFDELVLGTSPVNADSDGDGMSDDYESSNNFNPNDSGDADIDSDGDGLSNLQESILGTDPNSPDDHSDVGDEAVVNGSFSEPAIFVPGPDGKGTTGLEATKGEAGWNYWAGIPGWKAVQGENVELQTFATGPEDPNVELKAQPEGHRGIQQWIKTRVGVSYLVIFKALPRPYIGDGSLNDFEVYADEERIKEITYTGEVDPETVAWETHTAVFTAQQVLTKLSFVVPESNPDNTLGCIVDEIALLPVEVRDISNNKVITDIAWIKGHKIDGSGEEPEMPKLEARIPGLPDTIQVLWKLESRYPRRNGRDDLDVPYAGGDDPGVFTTGDQPWKIWEDIDFSTDPIFGGNETLKFKLIGSNGVLGEGVVEFKIRGENPDDARCKAYIVANQGDVWYAWAVAKHESKDSVGFYNQFANGLENGGAGAHGAKGEPFYAPEEGDGWGLFQRDSASEIAVTTVETWSWVGNMNGFLHDEYPIHLGIADSYVNSIQLNNPNTFEEPQFTIKGQSISGRHVLALTWYNGRQGRSNSTMLHFDGSKPTGQRWSLGLPNAPGKNQPYAHEIMDQYNGG